MRKALLTSIVFLMLFAYSTFGVHTVIAPYTADGQGFPLISPISIMSPSNITCSNNELSLVVTFKSLLKPDSSDLRYSIDGKNNVSIPLTGTREPREVTRTYENGTSVVVNSTLMVPYDVKGEVALPELSEGQHNITVYAKHVANQIVAFDESTVYFTITANAEEELPEFPSWLILPLLLVATLVAIIYKKRLNRISRQQNSFILGS
jgi:hypothetical protein